MSLYRDIVEYAHSLKLEPSTKEEARAMLLHRCAEIYERGTPLHERGEDRYTKEREGYYRSVYRRNPEATELHDQWSVAYDAGNTHDLKRLWRKDRVIAKLDARGSIACLHFGYLNEMECDSLAHHLSREVMHDIEVEIKESYPHKKSSRHMNITVHHVLAPGNVRASFDRGHVSLHITRRALREQDLPCPRVLNDAFNEAIILDAEEVGNGLWWMQWTKQAQGTKQILVVTGGYFEGVLYEGPSNVVAVRENANAVRKHSRKLRVTHAIQDVKEEKEAA